MKNLEIDNMLEDGKVIRKLGNNSTQAFLISKDDTDYFVKYKPVLKRGQYAKFYNFFGLTNLIFKKEVEVYENLKKISFKNFKYPKLISAQKDYLVTEFVCGEPLNSLTDIQKEELIQSLIEFQISGGQYFNYSFLINVVFKITSWRIFTLLRRNIFSMINTFGLRATLKVVIILQRSQFKNKKQKNKFLVHGDLNKLHSSRPYSNIINHKTEGINIIDFDSVKIYNKLVLQDIITMSFRVDAQILDFALIKLYFIKLKERITLSSSFNIDEQIRYELILIICNRSRIQKHATDTKRFLDILLDQESYNKWLHEQQENNL